MRDIREQPGADQLTTAAEQLRRAEARLRDAQLRLEAERRQPQQTTPSDGLRPLVSPSGRPPIRIEDNPAVTRPVVVKSVKPEHPLAAMQARVEGAVVLDALVDEQGRVADARVIKSIPLLDQAALDAARQWEFKPAMLNGEPVPIVIRLELNFALR